MVGTLANDLHAAFPQMKGFSVRNLKYMRAFALAYPNESFVQQVAAQIPWGQHCLLLDKVKDDHERRWYLQQTIEHGWSRNIREIQIETGLFQRRGKALTNFHATLPAPQSDLAHEALKDPYIPPGRSFFYSRLCNSPGFPSMLTSTIRCASYSYGLQ